MKNYSEITQSGFAVNDEVNDITFCTVKNTHL